MNLRNIFLFFSLFFILVADEIKLVNELLFDFNSKRYNTKDLYKDGPILINFWNLACEPCKKEMKFLNEFNLRYEKYGFKIFSINTDTPRSKSRVKSYLNSKQYSFTVLSDPKMSLFRKTGGSIFPYSLMVNGEGIIKSKHTGFNLNDEIKIEKGIIHILDLDTLEVIKLLGFNSLPILGLDSLQIIRLLDLDSLKSSNNQDN